MGDMDVFGTELAGDRLRHRAQSEFRAGKRRKTRSAAHAGGRAGEENVALAAREHQTRGLATGKEAGIAGHFPHFAENALGGVDDRKIHVGADVEDADLQRGVLLSLTTSDENCKTFGRKFLGDLTADKVPRSDNGYGRVSFFQG